MKILYMGTNNTSRENFEQALQLQQLSELIHCDYMLDYRNSVFPKNRIYDLIFIDMRHFLLERLIQLRNNNPVCQLVFLSSDKISSLKCLIHGPSIVMDINDLHAQMHFIHQWMEAQEAFRLIRKKHVTPIYLDEIIYLCITGHDLTIQCWHQKSYVIRRSLKGMIKEINHPDVIQIEKAIAVNLRYVQSFQSNHIQMADGTKFKIGRTFKKALKQQMISRQKIRML